MSPLMRLSLFAMISCASLALAPSSQAHGSFNRAPGLAPLANQSAPRPFSVHLLALKDADVDKLAQGIRVPLRNIQHMTKHETVDFILFFAHPSANENGVVSISCEVTFFDPSGQQILHRLDPNCYRAIPSPIVQGPLHTNKAITMHADPGDPAGTYTVRVKVTDQNSGQTATDGAAFTLDP